MARRSRYKARISQKRYRSRLAKYEKYVASTPESEIKSFRDWNADYRNERFFRKEYKIYKARFDKRKASARYGFRLTKSGREVVKYDYSDFKERYLVTRNTLVEEVEEGERDNVGSVINEMINDQAYELSHAKARGVANYLLEQEREFLVQKGLIVKRLNDEGEEVDYVKRKNLELLIRQGEFVRQEVGLWDEIKDFYATLRNQNFTAEEAKAQIGKTYFNSK